MTKPNHTPEHPADEELAAFALGKETANAETIAEHITNCTRCEALVAETPRDAFLGIVDRAKPGLSLTGPKATESLPPFVDELPAELRQQTKYAFLKKLGGGGMGLVYLAEHNLMKRKVAVKLIPPALIGNLTVRERFLQEVVSAAALEHPNVVRAYSAEEFGEHMVFEMEFVDGKDLGEVVERKGPLSVAHAVNYIRQAALALQHAMQKSLVHRDIKPGNLMLARTGIVKVADFGLAKFGRESDRAPHRSLTSAHAMMGTPDYMAPEQARNAKTADIRADIYSLGCAFYYLLAGRPPFVGESANDLIFRHWEDPRPDVGLLRHDVPPELSRYIQKMMAKEPDDRPRTPREAADWLAKFAKRGTTKADAAEKPVQGLDVAITPETATRTLGVSQKKLAPKKKWLTIACLLAGIAILAAVGVFRVKTKDGTIVLENLPADVQVLVDGEKAKLRFAGDEKLIEIQVAPGKHKLEVTSAGFKMESQELTIAAGERQPIGIRLEPITPPKGESKNFLPLFNGTDLTGWSIDSGPADRWSVENNVIKTRGSGSASRGWILTDREFDNFVLKFEFQVEAGADGAVGIRARPGDQINGLPQHLAVKITGQSQPNYPQTGALYYWTNTWQQPEKVSNILPNGQWNKMTVQVQGAQLRVTVNGEEVQNLSLARFAAKVNVLPGAKRSSGRIGLQQHSGEIRFRNLEIKELPSAPALDNSGAVAAPEKTTGTAEAK